MKTRGQVQQKLKQARFRHVQKALRRKFAGNPSEEPWPTEAVEQAKSEYREFFSKSIPEVAQKFPDVAALMWVLSEGEEPGPVLIGAMGGVSMWANSEEEARVCRELIDQLVNAATSATVKKEEPQEAKKSWFSKWFNG